MMRLFLRVQVPPRVTRPVTYTLLTVPLVQVRALRAWSDVAGGTPAVPASGSGKPQVTGEFVQNVSPAGLPPATALIGEQPAGSTGSG